MSVTKVLRPGGLKIVDYRCDAGPGDKPFVEYHDAFSLAYVRSGSFGYQTRGRAYELVAGSILVGHPGDEYVCTHDHVRGDDCLSVHLAPDVFDAIPVRKKTWRAGGVPPLSELVVVGELLQSAAEGRSDVGLDEAAMMLVGRFIALASGRDDSPTLLSSRDRRRAVETALWLDAHSHDAIDLEASGERSRRQRLSLPADVRARRGRDAASVSGSLAPPPRRAAAVGRRPLGDGCRVRCRLRRRLNFVRTFHRAAGVSPRRFRQAARGDRKILQDRLSAALLP